MKKSILLIAVAMMLVLSQCKKNDIGKNNNEIGSGPSPESGSENPRGS